jgi:hypothetical protein
MKLLLIFLACLFLAACNRDPGRSMGASGLIPTPVPECDGPCLHRI